MILRQQCERPTGGSAATQQQYCDIFTNQYSIDLFSQKRYGTNERILVYLSADAAG
jgi:hypothetical protein